MMQPQDNMVDDMDIIELDEDAPMDQESISISKGIPIEMEPSESNTEEVSVPEASSVRRMGFRLRRLPQRLPEREMPRAWAIRRLGIRRQSTHRC